MLGNHSNKKKTKWGRTNLAWGTTGELRDARRWRGGEPGRRLPGPARAPGADQTSTGKGFAPRYRHQQHSKFL